MTERNRVPSLNRSPWQLQIRPFTALAGLAVLVAIMLSTVGCAETITGLSVAYARGNLETVAPTDYHTTRLAAEATLRDLEVQLTRNEIGPEKTVLVGRNLQNQRVKILIRPRTEQASKVAIRVGGMGKHAAAAQVWEAFQSELITPSAATAEVSNSPGDPELLSAPVTQQR